MSKVNEKYASEALLSEEAKKKLGLVIKNGSVTTDKLKDGAVTPDKLEPELWENIDSTNRETQEGLNRLQEWMNEFAGGLEITANTGSYEAGKSASVTITARTKTGKKGDWVIRDSNNVTVYEESDASQITYTQTIDKDTYYSIICKQGDQTATGQWAIIAAFPTWLGAGNSYTDIKTDTYKRVVDKKVEGRYEVTVASGQRIYLLTPKEVIISKVTMGGFEIPMNDVEEVTLAISGYGNKVYKVYESSNTYQEGTYQVSVNVADSELVEHIEAIDKKIDSYPVADGEDIVAVTKTQPTEQQVLMLADKAYHPASFSGLGRKYLRKNIIPIEHEYRVFGGFVESVETAPSVPSIINANPNNVFFDRVREKFFYHMGSKYYMSWSSEEVPMNDYALTSEPLDMVFMYNGVPYKWDGENLLVDDEIQEDGLINLLTQDMINEPNTIYHIQYDYDLNGQTITISEGCTLEFEGGSIKNGTLSLNSNTIVRNGRFFGQNGETYLIYASNKNNILVDNCEVDGKNTAARGMLFSDCNDIFIKKCHVHGFKTIDSDTQGIYLRRVTNGIVSDCEVKDIEGTPNGVVGDGQGAARAFTIVSCKSVVVQNCVINNIYSSTSEDADGIHVIDETGIEYANIKIINNIISDCSTRFIKIQAKDVAIIGNELRNGDGFEPNYEIQVFTSNVTIEDNFIKGVSSVPIQLGSSALGNILENIRVVGNYVSNAKNAYQGAVTNGVELTKSVITNNVFDFGANTNNSAISLRKNASDVIIKDNKSIGGRNFLEVLFTTTQTLSNIEVGNNYSNAEFAFMYYQPNAGLSTTNLNAIRMIGNTFAPRGNALNNQRNAIYVYDEEENRLIARSRVLCVDNTPWLYIWNIRTNGTTEQRPSLIETQKGFRYFDETINKYVTWNGTEWIEGQNVLTFDNLPVLNSNNPVKSDGVAKAITFDTYLNIETITSIICWINTEREVWLVNNANQTGTYFEIQAGTRIEVTAPSGDISYIAFVKTAPLSSNDPVDYCEDTTRIAINAGETYVGVVPEDAVYMWFSRKSYAHDFTPSSIVLKNITSLQTKISQIESKLYVVGETVERPTSPAVGLRYFDTDLGKPIWWNGSTWVDSTGTAV